MPSFKVAPDASLVDRVAEFSYKKKARIQRLYAQDRRGYGDAVAKFVQTIACAGGLLGDKERTVPDATSILRERLVAAGRMELSPFFDAGSRPIQDKSTDEWLNSQWDNICIELSDPQWAAERAVLGHLKREVFYFWENEDSNWTAAWKARRKVTRPLPRPVRDRLVKSVEDLLRDQNISAAKPKVIEWVEENVATHFRSFGDYYLHANAEYMPAYSRSTLRFLDSQSSANPIDRLVMPFIGLAAMRKVKNRDNLVERVIDWSEGDGREIVSGLRDLQDIYLIEREQPKREKLLKDTDKMLNSIIPWQFRVFLNWLRLTVSAVNKNEVDVDATEAIFKSSVSRSKRWLWKIREPDLDGEWQKKLEDLLV